MENLTSQTYTNDPIGNTVAYGIITPLSIHQNTSTSNMNTCSAPTRLQVNERIDSIEMIYEETSLMTFTIYPSPPPQKRYFKIVFSCVDGKWNKSERIYGKKIEHQEYFEF